MLPLLVIVAEQIRINKLKTVLKSYSLMILSRKRVSLLGMSHLWG